MDNGIYLEAHVNISKITPESEAAAKTIASVNRWKMSDMNGNDPEQVSKKVETIFTCHTQDRDEMEMKVQTLVKNLSRQGFKVLRYKIEVAVVDSRASDIWSLLT